MTNKQIENEEKNHPSNQMSKEESAARIKASRRVIFEMARAATGKKHPFKMMMRGAA